MTEINQASPGDGAESLPVDLEACVMRLETAVFKGMSEEVEPYDLTHVEFSLLRACMRRQECTATELARVLPVDASRISRVVNTLVNLGLLQRRRLRSDRRTVMLTLTDEGTELTTRLHERMQEYYATLVAGISADDLRILEDATSRILANYDAIRESPRAP